MKDQDRIDFSALDVEPTHWQEITAATLARIDGVLEGRPSRMDPVGLLASWKRPVLTAAAALVGLLIPIELVLELRETNEEQIDSLVQVSGEAVWGVRQPTAAELLSVVGGQRLP